MKQTLIRSLLRPAIVLPIGFVAFLLDLVLAIFKALHLGLALFSGHWIAGAAEIFLNDIPFLGVIAFFSYASAIFRTRILRAICCLFVYAGTLWYLLDVSVISSLNARVPLSDIFHYAEEMGNVNEVKDLVLLSLAIFLVLMYARRFLYMPRRIRIALIVSFGLTLIPPIIIHPGTEMYATPIFIGRKNHAIVGSHVPYFSNGELDSLEATKPFFNVVDVDSLHRNIILVVIESLTASDSRQTSGLPGLLPKFDTLTHEGTLFTNFFANYVNTEGGLVSLLNGIPPMQYPADHWTQFKSYQHQDSIVRTYAESGYDTMFISSATLKFREKGTFIENIGFRTVLGLETVSEFSLLPRYAFEGISDHELYKKSLSLLRTLENKPNPFLFVIETTSSHLPYVDPLNRGNTEENVWSYVDDEISQLARELRSRGFFEHGILLITGDHHKMRPVGNDERKLYNETAEARIPLLAIGSGIPKDFRDERYFQQCDLLRSLNSIANQSTEFSPYITHLPPRFTPLIGANPEMSVIIEPRNENSPFYFATLGKTFEWIGGTALNSAIVEKDRRRMMARLQYCAEKENLGSLCH